MTLAVAMSGGVDSSTVAAILAENNPVPSTSGPAPIGGLTMQLWNQRRLPHLQGLEESPGGPAQASGRCCSPDDVYDARRVAHEHGIPYYVITLVALSAEKVVRPFAQSSLADE